MDKKSGYSGTFPFAFDKSGQIMVTSLQMILCETYLSLDVHQLSNITFLIIFV